MNDSQTIEQLGQNKPQPLRLLLAASLEPPSHPLAATQTHLVVVVVVDLVVFETTNGETGAAFAYMDMTSAWLPATWNFVRPSSRKECYLAIVASGQGMRYTHRI